MTCGLGKRNNRIKRAEYPSGLYRKTRTRYWINPIWVLSKPGPGIFIRPRKYSAGERRVAAADRGDPALGLLPVLLAAEGGQVEEGVGVPDILGAPAVNRVGVEDLVALAQEAAVARHLAGPLAAGQAGLGPVVVLGLAAGGVERDLV